MTLNSARISGDFHSEVNGKATLNDRAIALNPERQPAGGLACSLNFKDRRDVQGRRYRLD
jgi:hypothetical protein